MKNIYLNTDKNIQFLRNFLSILKQTNPNPFFTNTGNIIKPYRMVIRSKLNVSNIQVCCYFGKGIMHKMNNVYNKAHNVYSTFNV